MHTSVRPLERCRRLIVKSRVRSPIRRGREHDVGRCVVGVQSMLLAGDVGGTKTLLGIYEPGTPRPIARDIRRFATLDYPGLSAMVAEFIGARRAPRSIESAAFGVAGPVRGAVSELTNVPWHVDAMELAELFSIPRVRLLNDVVAMGHAVDVLTPDELTVLQAGRPIADGNAALIAPGTGCGVATLHRIGGRFVPIASEAGHADFAARTPREVRLLDALTTRFGRASYEHVLSGPGLTYIHAVTHDGAQCRFVADEQGRANLPAVITATALAGQCARCAETVDLFVSVLGAEAGNHGLRSMATAGVFIGGGIAPRLLPALRSPTFLKAFRAKAPMERLVIDMPVAIISADHPALLGAAVAATEVAAPE